MFDTIAAIATPPGEGGIGIIRVSGPEALEVAGRVFRAARAGDWAEKPGYRMYYGHVVDAASGEVIDEVLLSVMRAPHSYTREDVVEINCHGGWMAVSRVLQAVLKAGARLAEPGEFTRRAFVNGRIDLTQAEAVLDIIRSKTRESMDVAVSQLRGVLGAGVEKLREELVAVQAEIEGSIDFPEDVGAPAADELRARLQRIGDDIEKLVATSETGRVYREGLAVVIVGKPNVGKSSLLNALLGEERALVTAVPGTTRDVIEEMARIGGIPVRLADTAGVRETGDIVERMGIELARRKIGEADVVLLVLDAVQGIDAGDREAAALTEGKRRIVVVNKIDLAPEGIPGEAVRELAGDVPVVRASAKDGTGIADVGEAIGNVIGRLPAGGETPVVTNVRHRAALERAAECIRDAVGGVEKGLPLDIVAVDLYGALHALGEITGVTADEEIIDRIFAEFCVGK
ncbi:MAG TPA: tRNA uridine-5-carboxymethylaminomethyl(34) synthesis GTPase MnmE [Peptococcaceae bacterium]|nr:tRNA uridine-5-carboxymethylaminomethyl(34) synthesis GTPase MnmE [Peptococcaceae bacterium]